MRNYSCTDVKGDFDSYGKRGVAKATTPQGASSSELFLAGCANRANICTVTAGDALVSIDNVLVVAFRNARSGATVCACAAGDALIANLKCHCSVLHKEISYGSLTPTHIFYHTFEKNQELFAKKV